MSPSRFVACYKLNLPTMTHIPTTTARQSTIMSNILILSEEESFPLISVDGQLNRLQLPVCCLLFVNSSQTGQGQY